MIKRTIKKTHSPFIENRKIGIFDSGHGGLTIFKEISTLLKNYDYIYLGDNARTPYGNRSFETILKFTKEGIDFLFNEGCRIIIIACNTASARALRSIQQTYLTTKYKNDSHLRVLGVIRPTVEKVASLTKSNQVALWGTLGTVESNSFKLELDHYAPFVNLYQTACPLLVPLIESGELSGDGVDYFIRKYWNQTSNQIKQRGGSHIEIDTLLLGCTHYPLLQKEIAKIIPSSVSIIPQGELVATSLLDYFNRHKEMERELTTYGSRLFYTTDQCHYFDHLAEIFLGHKINSLLATLSGEE